MLVYSQSQLLLPVKHELKVLPETARIVVAQRLSIPKRLEQRVRLQENVLHAFHCRCVGRVAPAATHRSDVVLNLFGRFGLPSPRLAADDHALALFFADHLAIRRFGDAENVWGSVNALLVHVIRHLINNRIGLVCLEWKETQMNAL